MQTTSYESSMNRDPYREVDAWTDNNDRALSPPRQGESLRVPAERKALGLALFSLGLGLLEVTAPGKLAEIIGMKNNAQSRRLLKLFGLREIASGVGLLAKSNSSEFLWARLAGDAMDLALLGNSMTNRSANRARLAAAGAAVLGVTALDTLTALKLSRNSTLQKLVLPIHVVRTITINRSPDEVYSFWRNFENLPRFMAHLESVRIQDGVSTWRAKAPAGMTIEWQAETTIDRPGETIAWRSLEGALVPNRGVVRFSPAPGNRGTQLLVELKYDPPGGALAAAIAKLFGEEPSQQIAGDLRRLKQVLETGEVVHSDASIHRGMHCARPAGKDEKTQILGTEEQQ